MSDVVSREADAEAGSYIEDDPAAWHALVDAFRRYVGDVPALRERFGEAGDEIAVGAMLSYLADQHGVFVGRNLGYQEARDDVAAESKLTEARLRRDMLAIATQRNEAWAALAEVAKADGEAREMFRRNSIEFDKWPPEVIPPERWNAETLVALDPETRWQGIAFSLYTSLCQVSSQVENVLKEYADPGSVRAGSGTP